MANQLGTNPITVDSVMAAAAFPTGLRVSSAIWMSPTTVGHNLVIVDSHGNPVATLKAPVANQNVDVSTLDAWWTSGFRVTQIDSGLLVIFLD